MELADKLTIDFIKHKIQYERMYRFVLESNRIEGITRIPTDNEVDEHIRFINLDFITVQDMVKFVSICEPKAKLRNEFGLNVTVGNHKPPAGNPNMLLLLEDILESLEYSNPFQVHGMYETLHPFTDGNGRSGRALWAWHMKQKDLPYDNFLHTFYYQSLDNFRC